MIVRSLSFTGEKVENWIKFIFKILETFSIVESKNKQKKTLMFQTESHDKLEHQARSVSNPAAEDSAEILRFVTPCNPWIQVSKDIFESKELDMGV